MDVVGVVRNGHPGVHISGIPRVPPCIAPSWPPKAAENFVVFFGQIPKANGPKSGDLGIFSDHPCFETQQRRGIH